MNPFLSSLRKNGNKIFKEKLSIKDQRQAFQKDIQSKSIDFFKKQQKEIESKTIDFFKKQQKLFHEKLKIKKLRDAPKRNLKLILYSWYGIWAIGSFFHTPAIEYPSAFLGPIIPMLFIILVWLL